MFKAHSQLAVIDHQAHQDRTDTLKPDGSTQ